MALVKLDTRQTIDLYSFLDRFLHSGSWFSRRLGLRCLGFAWQVRHDKLVERYMQMIPDMFHHPDTCLGNKQLVI